MKRVIFACVHNAGRSQMAAALFSATADPARVEALSAGTMPGDRVHPEVVDVMREIGIDISGRLASATHGLLGRERILADHDGMRRRVSVCAWPGER